MRVPPPKSMKLERAALLADVRERLAERLPEYADGVADPTDPGWLLLEQAAWMVEMLTEQLDHFPYAVIHQLIHLMGGQLRPAQPALGVMVVHPEQAGELRVPASRPTSWRFYTSQTEERDIIEFLPAESGVPVRPGRVSSITALRGGELMDAGVDERPEGLAGQVAWRGDLTRSRTFDREVIRYTVLGADAASLHKTMEEVIAGMKERHPAGWLGLSAALESERVVLTAWVDPALAFADEAPGGLAMGGDLAGSWGSLLESTWTPPVTVADHPGLPLRIRGTRPLPGAYEGSLLVPDVPPHFPVAELLERRAAPIPDSVVEAIWSTLASMDTRLAALRPVITRDLLPPEDPETDAGPVWVANALRGDAWRGLAGEGERTFIHVDLGEAVGAATSLRVGLVPARSGGLPAVLARGIERAGLGDAPLEATIAWALPAPARDGGRGMDRVFALDIPLSPEHSGVLLAVDGRVEGAFLNAVLAINAPVVQDGRGTSIDRTVPTGISLFNRDLVTAEVIEQLLDGPIPRDTAARIRAVPLSLLEVEGQQPIRDFQGVNIDPSAGELVLNAPDPSGDTRTLRPGTRLTLQWYRRTDGALGEVPAGAVQYVGQSNRLRPRLLGVTNPLGTWFGGARESDEAAVERLFAPAGETPVLPSDWELAIRRALGSRARGWVVRCWSYSERALVSAGIWPLDSHDPEALALQDALKRADPKTLLVVLGPSDELLSHEDLDWARQTVEDLVQRLARRLPAVRAATVARFWPLSMRVEETAEAPPLPTFDVGEMRGTLVDPTGREAPPPQREVLLLNAAVVRVRAEWT